MKCLPDSYGFENFLRRILNSLKTKRGRIFKALEISPDSKAFKNEADKQFPSMTALDNLLRRNAGVVAAVWKENKLPDVLYPKKLPPEVTMYGVLSNAVHNPAGNAIFFSDETDEEMKKFIIGYATLLSMQAEEYSEAQAAVGKELETAREPLEREGQKQDA